MIPKFSNIRNDGLNEDKPVKLNKNGSLRVSVLGHLFLRKFREFNLHVKSTMHMQVSTKDKDTYNTPCTRACHHESLFNKKKSKNTFTGKIKHRRLNEFFFLL